MDLSFLAVFEFFTVFMLIMLAREKTINAILSPSFVLETRVSKSVPFLVFSIFIL